MRVFERCLDYMFVRDLKVRTALALDAEGSDHNTLLATVSF